MARFGLCVAFAALLGCGLLSKDYDVELPFQAGGLPSSSGTLQSSSITGPLSADVSRISSVTLKAARIEATDSGDVSIISGAGISVSGSAALASALLATLPSPAPQGAKSVSLQTTDRELKPYLQAGGAINATINYSPTPAAARTFKLVLTFHGSLL